jgi:hypothetical protein
MTHHVQDSMVKLIFNWQSISHEAIEVTGIA